MATFWNLCILNILFPTLLALSQQANQEALEKHTRLSGASKGTEQGKRQHEKTVPLLRFKKIRASPKKKILPLLLHLMFASCLNQTS